MEFGEEKLLELRNYLKNILNEMGKGGRLEKEIFKRGRGCGRRDGSAGDVDGGG